MQQQSPEVSPQFLFSFVLGGLLIIYHILHGLLRWPPLLDLLFMIVGTVMGQGAREMLQSVFSHGAARSVRTRAASLVGYGDGGTFVGGLWNMGNTCYQNSVLQVSRAMLLFVRRCGCGCGGDGGGADDVGVGYGVAVAFEAAFDVAVDLRRRRLYEPLWRSCVPYRNS